MCTQSLQETYSGLWFHEQVSEHGGLARGIQAECFDWRLLTCEFSPVSGLNVGDSSGSRAVSGAAISRFGERESRSCPTVPDGADSQTDWVGTS